MQLPVNSMNVTFSSYGPGGDYRSPPGGRDYPPSRDYAPRGGRDYMPPSSHRYAPDSRFVHSLGSFVSLQNQHVQLCMAIIKCLLILVNLPGGQR